MEQCPQIAVAFQNNMCATAAIATIGAAHRRKLIAHKMPAAGAAMPALAKNPNLVNKITFLQNLVFVSCNYTIEAPC